MKQLPILLYAYLILFIIPSVKMQVSKDYQMKISLIYRDLIDDLERPLKLTALVCWDDGEYNYSLIMVYVEV